MQGNLTNRIFTTIFIIYLIIVAYLSFGHVTPPSSWPMKIYGIYLDKYVHFLMFFPYVILAHLAFCRKNFWRTLVIVLITGIFVSFPFELLQTAITEYRTTEPWDLVINMGAMATGGFAVTIFGLAHNRQ